MQYNEIEEIKKFLSNFIPMENIEKNLHGIKNPIKNK